MNVLKYREFEGTAELDVERNVCRGKILHIDDLVTYEAATPAQLQSEFIAAVEDYEETCHLIGKEPQRPCKGQFQVRVAPEVHRMAVRRAAHDGQSLNALVSKALEVYLEGEAVAMEQQKRSITISQASAAVIQETSVGDLSGHWLPSGSAAGDAVVITKENYIYGEERNSVH